MKKLLVFVLAVTIVFGVCITAASASDAAPLIAPQTEYAAEFIEKCEGEEWYLNEIERLLNAEGKTINTLSGADDLANIRTLGLRERDIEGKIPAAIGELRELRYLFLSGNKLTGDLPASFFTLPELQNIDLSDNSFSGAIPEGFGTMPALTLLNLKGNSYSGTIPESILSNAQINVLNLMGNKLTGGVPAQLSGMTGLKYLNLSQNDLGGAIPDLSALTNLVSLSLWDCGLTGEIPDSIYSLSNLQILDLSQNELEGEISGNISRLTKLQYLALDGNKLRGTLPDAFTSSDLAEAHFEGNYLRGLIPASLISSGADLFLNDNYMTGETLKDSANNSGNFADGAETQHRLSSTKEKVQIRKESETNLYSLLRITPEKELLRPDEFTVSYDAAKLELCVDDSGIYIKALEDIPDADGVFVTVCIKDNTGSEYSTVKIFVTTETVSTGGGGIVTEPTQPTVTHKKYINGFPDGTFGPKKDLTREQAATMLINALELSLSEETDISFTDVLPERWSYKHIMTAAAHGFFKGYAGGEFKPGKSITRAELATVLVRIAEANEMVPTRDEDAAFSDVSEEMRCYQYITKAAKYGLVKGNPDGSFRPNDPVTRAEAVVMINRLLSRDYKTAEELKTLNCPFSDVTESYWAYGDIMEASVTHKH